MLTVTPNAADHLVRMLSHPETPQHIAMRIREVSGNLKIYADTPRNDDVTFNHRGRTVLVFDQEVSHMLDRSVLDVIEGPDGKKFTLM